MINAEELKELIEKEAIVYGVQNNKIFEIRLKKDFFEDNDTSTLCKFAVIDDCLEINNDFGLNEYAWLIEYLYETKSEAEFVAKYKNIRRTETLDLPTWKEAEIDKIIKISNNQNYCWYLIKSFTDKKNNEMFEFSLSKDDDQFYLSVNNEDSSYKDLFNKPLTYENYLKACEICRKLFLGEEVWNQ